MISLENLFIKIKLRQPNKISMIAFIINPKKIGYLDH